MSQLLRPGDLAPDFGIPDHNGIASGLHNQRGHNVLLWWYPKADTPG